jgi:hypothetical protein
MIGRAKHVRKRGSTVHVFLSVAAVPERILVAEVTPRTARIQLAPTLLCLTKSARRPSVGTTWWHAG